MLPGIQMLNTVSQDLVSPRRAYLIYTSFCCPNLASQVIPDIIKMPTACSWAEERLAGLQCLGLVSRAGTTEESGGRRKVPWGRWIMSTWPRGTA